MAHVAGLVAGGVYPSPIPHAAITSTTTQKTLRGAWGAIILCTNDWQKAIDSAVFPGTQGGPLMHAIAAKAVCFGEALKPEFKVYAKQVVANAKAMADQLTKRGLRLVSGGTDNHLMLIDLKAFKRTGKQVQDIADTVGITLNRNSIPFDDAPKFNPSGVLAQPGGRHAHSNVTPLLGGLAMWIGFAAACLVLLPHDLQTLGVIAVSGLAMGLLTVDDKVGMRPLVKLGIQVGLALIAVLA